MSEYGKKVAKKMSEYNGNVDSVDEEIHDIQHAIEGVEVRGALGSGVRKAHEVSKNADGKATEAHDVMESIMEEGFDNAALESNFEQKLDDKIESLQPEWTQFKDETKSQLADTEKQRFTSSPANNKEPILACSIVDDDHDLGFYTKLFQIAKEFNIPLTSAIITSNLNGSNKVTAEQRKEMHESGLVEFLSHTHAHNPNHRPSDMTDAELDLDLRTSQQIMKELGFNYYGIVLPFAERDERLLKFASRYFDYTIGTGISSVGKPNYLEEFDNHYIWRVTLQNGFDHVRDKLNEAKEHGIAWVVFVTHVDQGGWYSDEYMRQCISYALSLGFKFVKTQEGFERFGNKVQMKDTHVSADGDVYGEKLGRVQYKPRSKGVGFDTPRTVFPDNAKTFTDINTPSATKFPYSLPGILETNKYVSSPYDFQEYVTSREFLKYIRGWDSVLNDWDEFIQKDFMRYYGLNGISVDESPLSARLRRQISYTFIDSQGNAEFPEKRSGLYVINALHATNSFPIREYHIFSTNRVYRSYWISASEGWSEFELQPYHMNTLRRLDQSFTVGANSTSRVYIESSGIGTTQIPHARTNGLLPTGIIMSVHIPEDGRAVITLANVTNEDIEIKNVDFELLRIG